MCHQGKRLDISNKVKEQDSVYFLSSSRKLDIPWFYISVTSQPLRISFLSKVHDSISITRQLDTYHIGIYIFHTECSDHVAVGKVKDKKKEKNREQVSAKLYTKRGIIPAVVPAGKSESFMKLFFHLSSSPLAASRDACGIISN